MDFVELKAPDFCLAWCTRLQNNNDALLAFRRSLDASDDLSSLTSRVSRRSASRFLLDIDQSQAAKSAAINLKLTLDEEWTTHTDLSASQEIAAKVPEFKVPRRVIYDDHSASTFIASLESDDDEDPSQKTIAAVALSDRNAAVAAVTTLQRSSRASGAVAPRAGGIEELAHPPPVSTYDASAEEESEAAAQTLLRGSIGNDKPVSSVSAQNYTQYLGRLGPAVANPSSRGSEPRRPKSEPRRGASSASSNPSVAAVPLSHVLSAVDPLDMATNVWKEVFRFEHGHEVAFDDSFKAKFCSALSITRDRDELLGIFRLLAVSSENTISFERLLRTIRRFGWGHEMLQKMIDVLRTSAFNFDMSSAEVEEELQTRTPGSFVIYFAPESTDVFTVSWRSAQGQICFMKRVVNNPGRGIKIETGHEGLVFSSWKSFLDAATVMTTPVVSRKRSDFHPSNMRHLESLAKYDIYTPPEALAEELLTLGDDLQPLPAPPPAGSTRRASQRRTTGAQTRSASSDMRVSYADAQQLHFIESPYSNQAKQPGHSHGTRSASASSASAATASHHSQNNHAHAQSPTPPPPAPAPAQASVYPHLLPGQFVAHPSMVALQQQHFATMLHAQRPPAAVAGTPTGAGVKQEDANGHPHAAAMPRYAVPGPYYQMATPGGYAMFPQALMNPQFIMAGQSAVGAQHPQAVMMAQPSPGAQYMTGFLPAPTMYQLAPSAAKQAAAPSMIALAPKPPQQMAAMTSQGPIMVPMLPPMSTAPSGQLTLPPLQSAPPTAHLPPVSAATGAPAVAPTPEPLSEERAEKKRTLAQFIGRLFSEQRLDSARAMKWLGILSSTATASQIDDAYTVMQTLAGDPEIFIATVGPTFEKRT